ncbi:hypothetical protein D1155_11910 [Anaerotruncus sp. 80]|uniref:Peptidase S9 prolyl oligopeptidase catalytic domain-containing protein n=1 Tax=Anaerotruncus colihominis TaxID=169435 RepID=A0A845QNQ6_9FIRM|nr:MULTISPECIES: alpha/beta family hydrolase [Anaerotruncus]MCI9639307.1 prolyl oligopeptidase family serine peptidase [Emergencia sp.]NBH62353.1 hypothetical protein [Anaerotruncus colihominis]NCF03008.1 hypothetical protein [Anaerotruncus sp. 80]
MMKQKVTILLLMLFLTGSLWALTGCESKNQGICTLDVMIKNEEETYTKAQIVIPENWEEEKLPLVFLSHGFHGNMNSAGGKYLAQHLAENGIATIRMDFGHYEKADTETEQTNQYTVDTMVADQVLCTDYMVAHYNVDPDRIGIFGRSLGGRAAMYCGNEHAGGYAYKAMVLVAPAGNGDSFQRYMGGAKNWEKFKREAREKGSVTHQKVILTPEFFRSIEDYVPSETGYKFQAPVLVIYNTEDYVVLPEVSLECARSYEDVKTIEITSVKSPHGYEMGFEKSEIKDMLFDEITKFYLENL